MILNKIKKEPNYSILKFKLGTRTPIKCPKIVKFLDVQVQDGKVVMWVLCDLNATEEEYIIHCIGTGWSEIYINKPDNYIATTQVGEYVWHFFWERID